MAHKNIAQATGASAGSENAENKVITNRLTPVESWEGLSPSLGMVQPDLIVGCFSRSIGNPILFDANGDEATKRRTVNFALSIL